MKRDRLNSTVWLPYSGIIIIISVVVLLSSCINTNQDSKTLEIKTDMSEGFYFEMLSLNCDTILEVQFFVSQKDTSLLIASETQNVVFKIMNANKTAMVSTPMYLEEKKDITYTIERLIPNNLKEINQFSSGAIGTNQFLELWSSIFKGSLEKQNKQSANIEILNKHKTQYPNNLMASFLLLQFDSTWQQTNEEIRQIENCSGLKAYFSKLDKFKKGKTHKLSDSYNQFMSDLVLNIKPLNDFEFDSFEQTEVIKIFFWASWCTPCLKEFSTMEKEEFQYANNWFISVDKNEESAIKIAKKYNIKNLFVSESVWLKKYGIKSIPTHLVVNKKEKKVAITH